MTMLMNTLRAAADADGAIQIVENRGEYTYILLAHLDRATGHITLLSEWTEPTQP